MTVVQDGSDNYFQYCAINNDSNCTDMNGNAHGWADGIASDDSTVTSSTVGDDNTVVVAHATGQNNTNENITNIDIVGDRNKHKTSLQTIVMEVIHIVLWIGVDLKKVILRLTVMIIQ